MYKTYARRLTLLSDPDEIEFITHLKQTCYSTVYPYKIFPSKGLREVELHPITIFYGGNGSGKTTLLNILAEKAHVARRAAFSGSAFFSRYVSGCTLDARPIPPGSQILTSDDVFDYLLHLRALNNGIDLRRDELFAEYLERKGVGAGGPPSNPLRSLADYDEWLETYDTRRKTQSQFTRERLIPNAEMHSNGESALGYFVEHITDDALYLLDEPENSLSIALQQELCTFLSDSARHFGCQLVIATHSPVLLSMRDAVIYDLDAYPVCVRPWTELENVRKYFEFFESHRHEFLR